MLKNYLLATLNIIVFSLPILFTWDLIVGVYFYAFSIALLALLAWNIVGDMVIVFLVFRARRLPQEAIIAPIIQQYFLNIKK